MLIMLACCLIPIGLILAVGVFGITLGSLTPFLPFAIVLLCPLLMFFMMRGMGHDHGEGETHHTEALPALPGRSLAKAHPAQMSSLARPSTRVPPRTHTIVDVERATSGYCPR